jgi:hypothetical protein
MAVTRVAMRLQDELAERGKRKMDEEARRWGFDKDVQEEELALLPGLDRHSIALPRIA